MNPRFLRVHSIFTLSISVCFACFYGKLYQIDRLLFFTLYNADALGAWHACAKIPFERIRIPWINRNE